MKRHSLSLVSPACVDAQAMCCKATRVAVGIVLSTIMGFALPTLLCAQAYNDQATYPGRAGYGALKFSQHSAYHSYLMLDVHRAEARRAEALQQAYRSPESMRAYIDTVRSRMRSLVGPLPERTDVQGRVVGTVQGDGFRVEKVVFQSLPGRYVTAHLYLPEGDGQVASSQKDRRGQGAQKSSRGRKADSDRLPACIEMCGHSLTGKGDGSSQAVAMAKNGIAVMVVDPLAQGERLQLIDDEGHALTRGVTTEHTLLGPGLSLLGSSLAAQEYWDNSRAIDYLQTRPDIDPQRIGAYGFSGGGTQATYLMALDDRLACTCVGLFFSSRARTLDMQGPSDGCQQIAGEGRLGLEIADMALCAAPRPLLVLDGVYDFVDHWGALQGVEEVHRVYEVLGYADRVNQHYSQDGHACPPDAMGVLVTWFRRWLGCDGGEDADEADGPAMADNNSSAMTDTSRSVVADASSLIDIDAHAATDAHAAADARSATTNAPYDVIVDDAIDPSTLSVNWRGQDMLCTPQGQVNLAFADARTLMQENLEAMEALEAERNTFVAGANSRASGVDQSSEPSEIDEDTIDSGITASMRSRIMSLLGLPEAFCDSIEWVGTGRSEGRERSEYRFQINCQGQMPVPCVVWVPATASEGSAVEIHLHEQGKAWYLSDLDKRDAVSDGTIILAADCIGLGEMEDPYIYNYSKYWNRDYRLAATALHIGRPLMGQRVAALRTLLNFCSQHDLLRGRTVRVVADGVYGPVVMHTAVLDERISRATLTRCLKTWRSYLEQPLQRDMLANVLPGVLRYYDLPDLVALSRGRVKVVD